MFNFCPMKGLSGLTYAELSYVCVSVIPLTHTHAHNSLPHQALHPTAHNYM